MLRDWNRLSEGEQLTLSREALLRAVEMLAQQAETLAVEIEAGRLADRGGPDALRLLACIARETARNLAGPVGHA